MKETFAVTPEQIAAVHALIGQWLLDAEREATHAWEGGRGGYIGTLKLRAYVSDDGLCLHMERSFEGTVL